jgi:hypothetical protein
MTTPAAPTIFGQPYSAITNVFTNNVMMGAEIDAGSFADDGNVPPKAYSFTLNNQTQGITLPAAVITGVGWAPPQSPSS